MREDLQPGGIRMRVEPTDGKGFDPLRGERIIMEMHVQKKQELDPVFASKDDVKKAVDEFVEKLEKLRKIFRGEAVFKYDEELDMVIVKIKDPETGEIIRQIPPEVVVKIAKSVSEFLGILLDERV